MGCCSGPREGGWWFDLGVQLKEGRNWVDLELSMEVKCQGLLRWKVKEGEKQDYTQVFSPNLCHFLM